MALFFDQEWFDARLRALGRTREDVAAALRVTREEVDEIWKDQRELGPNEVTMLARLLEVPAAEIVNRAGIATPMPSNVMPSNAVPSGAAAAPGMDMAGVNARLDEMNARLARIERAVADLQSLVLATRRAD